jgi:hypothetical protein
MAQTAAAPAASAPKAKTAQQSKMGACNEQAGDKKGAERKAFMKECLSAKAPGRRLRLGQDGPAGEDEDLQRRRQGQEPGRRRTQGLHEGMPEREVSVDGAGLGA